MSTQHTPGPWKVDENTELALAVIQDNEDGKGICEIGYPDTTHADATPELFANARLITAAPELLATLKVWAEFAVNRDVPFVLISETRAAIAKAEGRAEIPADMRRDWPANGWSLEDAP